MTGAREPALPPDRDFDHINADVIVDNLSVKDEQLVLPHGVSYKVLVLPRQDTMRPAVLRKIRDLIRAGATVLGPPPVKSPSLQNQPRPTMKSAPSPPKYGAMASSTKPANAASAKAASSGRKT